MVYKCIGKKYVSFKDSKDPTRLISGYKLFGSYPILDKGEGVGTFDCFISDWFISNKMTSLLPSVGDDFEVLYNRYGKVEDIRVTSLA